MDELSRTNNSITEIVERYSDMILRLALSQTKDRTSADDVYQEVFLRLCTNIHKLKSLEHIKAWLIRVTLNCSRSHLNSYWNRNVVPIPDDFSFIEDKEDSDVYMAVLELPQKYRTVIHLFYYEDMSINDIAKTLKQSHGATKTQLNRARARLRETLGREYFYV